MRNPNQKLAPDFRRQCSLLSKVVVACWASSIALGAVVDPGGKALGTPTFVPHAAAKKTWHLPFAVATWPRGRDQTSQALWSLLQQLPNIGRSDFVAFSRTHSVNHSFVRPPCPSDGCNGLRWLLCVITGRVYPVRGGHAEHVPKVPPSARRPERVQLALRGRRSHLHRRIAGNFFGSAEPLTSCRCCTRLLCVSCRQNI